MHARALCGRKEVHCCVVILLRVAGRITTISNYNNKKKIVFCFD
jgi:hypothetical protein